MLLIIITTKLIKKSRICFKKIISAAQLSNDQVANLSTSNPSAATCIIIHAVRLYVEMQIFYTVGNNEFPWSAHSETEWRLRRY